MAYSIYNSWQGALTISITPSKQTLAFNLAKPFNPQKGGKVEKGTKVYDWENSVWFAMTVDECQRLLDYWKAQQFQENFHLVHSTSNSTNFFNFSLSGDKFYLNIGPKGNQISLGLAPEQISILMKGCNYMTTVLPWEADILKEQGRMIDHKSSFNPGNDMNGKPYEGQGGYNPNNGNGQYNNGGYQKRNNYNNNGNYQRNYNNNGGYQNNNSYQPAPQPQPQVFTAPKPPVVPQPVQQNNYTPMPQPVSAPVPQPVNNNNLVDDFTV